MPNISVRSFAELIHTPLYGQMRILREQKYPKEAPAIFKVGYYKPALRLIEKFYLTDDPSCLPATAAEMTGCGTIKHKRPNNFRVIERFREGWQIEREVDAVYDTTTETCDFGPLTVRATPDMNIEEDGEDRYFLFDCRVVEPDEEIIRTTVELFHHILEANDVDVVMRNIEYICIDSDQAFSWNKPRKRTITRANQTAVGVTALWGQL